MEICNSLLQILLSRPFSDDESFNSSLLTAGTFCLTLHTSSGSHPGFFNKLFLVIEFFLLVVQEKS